MNELALFAGIGGGVLAGKLLGWRTVCAVERDAYAAAVLAHWQNEGNGQSGMTARIKHWTVRRSRRRVAGYWEIVNGKGVVAVVYTTEADAREMANAPKYKGSLKHMVAIVRLREGELRASEKAKYDAARALVNELEGG